MAFDFFRSKPQTPPAKKAISYSSMVSYTGSGRAAWSARDVASLTQNGFLCNPVGFRCVKLIAETASALPFYLQDAKARYDQHPISKVLARPNSAQGGAEFLEALFGQLILSGNGYVEAVGAERPEELHILRSDRVSLIPGSDGWPVAYEYNVGGKKLRFDMTGEAAPICHIRSFHPQDDHYGMTPLQAAAAAIDVHNSASNWSKALLDNAARPSGALVYAGVDGSSTMTEEQFARLQDEMATYHQGARNAGRPMLLEGGLDWKPMGFSPSDMEFQKTKEAAAREIALAFGVPPMLLGIPGDATYANYQEANRAFYRLTVLPLAAKVFGALSFWLGRHFGDDVKMQIDLDEVSALAPEREAKWARVTAAQFLTDEEKRRLLGLPIESLK